MPTGLLIKLGIVLALAAAIGVQSLRLAWSEAALERKAGELAQAHRDIKDAADINAGMAAANVTLLIERQAREEANARLTRRANDLDRRLTDSEQKAMSNAALPPQPDQCFTVDPRFADHAGRL